MLWALFLGSGFGLSSVFHSNTGRSYFTARNTVANHMHDLLISFSTLYYPGPGPCSKFSGGLGELDVTKNSTNSWSNHKLQP